MGDDSALRGLAGWFARGGDTPSPSEPEGGGAAASEGSAAERPASPGGAAAGAAGCFIGPGVRLVGTLRCGADVTVVGRVEGPIYAKGQVVVERDGLTEGDITAATIRIRGRTRGTLVATAEVALEAGAAHSGGLQTPSLVVEPGARVDGEVKAGSGTPLAVEPLGDVPGGEGARRPVA